MNTDIINKAFVDLLADEGRYKSAGINPGYASTLRNKLANGIGISLDTKIRYLQRSGWRQDDHQYTQKDLVLLAQFILTASEPSKRHGAEYLVEKYINKPST